MNGQPKPLASLSSGLLARKGQARPAMRPQGLGGPMATGDDLGWNDMGGAPATDVPAVLAARAALREEIEATAAVQAPFAISVATAARLRRETAHAKKAAFTLRLDENLHLRLRIASATRNCSAQEIVTGALDAFLATMPEVDMLVAQLPLRKR